MNIEGADKSDDAEIQFLKRNLEPLLQDIVEGSNLPVSDDVPENLPALIDTSVDNANIAFGSVLYRLRQHTGVYRVICLNAGKIEDSNLSVSFFYYVKRAALDGIALCLCAIFEPEKKGKGKKYELDSIDGILNKLTGTQFDPCNSNGLEELFTKYPSQENASSLERLTSVVVTFRSTHKIALDQFYHLRDKKIAHSEHDMKNLPIPGYAEMKNLFEFAEEFYRAVHFAFIGVTPAYLPPHAEVGLVATLKRLGVENPRQFP